MTTLQPEETKVDQGKDGMTNTYENGMSNQLANTPIQQTLRVGTHL
jgi:hypothetical protein